MSDLERRYTPVRVEIRAGKMDPKMMDPMKMLTIGGYAARFNLPSQNLGGFREFIAPGSFNRAASRGWPGSGVGVMARYNHEDNYLLGNSGSGSLRLSVDDEGLAYEVDLPQARADVYELVQRGDIRSSSFAFVAEQDDWATDDSGFPVRTLQQVQLVDVAPVNSPAYLDTSVGLRSLAKKFDADVEEVRKMAAQNELTRFFKRTDDAGTPEQKRSAQAALAKVLGL